MGSQIIGLPREHMGLIWPWMEASFIEIIERLPIAPGCPALYSHMTIPLCLLLPPYEQLQAPILVGPSLCSSSPIGEFQLGCRKWKTVSEGMSLSGMPNADLSLGSTNYLVK